MGTRQAEHHARLGQHDHGLRDRLVQRGQHRAGHAARTPGALVLAGVPVPGLGHPGLGLHLGRRGTEHAPAAARHHFSQRPSVGGRARPLTHRAGGRRRRQVPPAAPAEQGPRRDSDIAVRRHHMAVQAETAGPPAAPGRNWYACTPAEVAAAVGVDPDAGLTGRRAADLLATNGPNALPEEKPKPGWLRFLDEYRSYMQIILVAAAIVSLLIKEWSTAILLVLLTVLNAVVGLRQEGKAESAMNALKSMMKATARVRRDGSESVIPAEQVVVGDVVLISAGDEVPADGRIVAASRSEER